MNEQAKGNSANLFVCFHLYLIPRLHLGNSIQPVYTIYNETRESKLIGVITNGHRSKATSNTTEKCCQSFFEVFQIFRLFQFLVWIFFFISFLCSNKICSQYSNFCCFKLVFLIILVTTYFSPYTVNALDLKSQVNSQKVKGISSRFHCFFFKVRNIHTLSSYIIRLFTYFKLLFEVLSSFKSVAKFIT